MNTKIGLPQKLTPYKEVIGKYLRYNFMGVAKARKTVQKAKVLSTLSFFIPTEREILTMMEEIRANSQDFRFVA